NADKIRRPEQVVQTDQLGAHRRRGVAVDVGIVRDEPEPERPGEPADLTPDVAEADDAEHAVHDAHAHMVAFLSPAAGASEPILDEEFLAERQDIRHRGQGDRPADAVRCDRDRDALPGARSDVDGIVPHAESGDDREAVVPLQRLGGHFGSKHEESIVAADQLVLHLGRISGQVLPLDIGAVPDELEPDPEPELAFCVEKVPRQADSEPSLHGPLNSLLRPVGPLRWCTAGAQWANGNSGLAVALRRWNSSILQGAPDGAPRGPDPRPMRRAPPSRTPESGTSATGSSPRRDRTPP